MKILDRLNRQTLDDKKQITELYFGGTGGGDEDPPTYMYVRPTQFQISYQGQGLVDATFTVTKPCIVNFLASANVYNESQSPNDTATVNFRVLLTGGAQYPNDTYTDFLTLYDRVEPNDFLSFSRADATYLAYPFPHVFRLSRLTITLTASLSAAPSCEISTVMSSLTPKR